MWVGKWWDSVRRAAVESLLSRAVSRRQQRGAYGQRNPSMAEGLEARIVLSSATHLVLVQAPTSAATGSSIGTVLVDVEDASNNLVGSDTSTVTLTLSSGVFSTGSNTVSAAASSGVATFANLVIGTAGTYTVSATDGMLAPATSGAFGVYLRDDIHSFSPFPNGTEPFGNVALDSSGDLFGTTFGGGASGSGTVFEIFRGSCTITTLASFNGTDGNAPYAGITLDSSGDLFGTASKGGSNNDGTVFEIAHGSSSITVLASFNGLGGFEPEGNVTLDSSGNIFGTTLDGGTEDDGTVFEIAHGTNSIATIANLTSGRNPGAGVTFDSNGNLFGTTSSGGAYGYGTVFEVVQGSGDAATIASFNYTDGSSPVSAVVFDASGNMFGTTEYSSPGGGTVFEIAHGTTNLTVLARISTISPSGGVSLDLNGNLFGATNNGGAGYGTLFEITHGSSSIVTLASFNGTNGETPLDAVTLDASGDLFGTANAGGVGNQGTVFELSHGATTITVIGGFPAASDGEMPQGLTFDSAGDALGATEYGGTNNDGTVFEIPVGATTLSYLADFNSTNGADPDSVLTPDSSGDLFGTTKNGGGSNYGTVFEIMHGSSAITTIATFNYGNGDEPLGGVIVDSSGDLFGTSATSATSSYGTVFEVLHGSTTISTLASFNDTNGFFPMTGVVLDSAGNLFGVTEEGGIDNEGTVFEIANDTGTITTLVSFNTTNGEYPEGRLVFDSADDLFGTTYEGGASSYGTVFEIAHATTTLTTVASFNFSNGANPAAALSLDSHGDIIGTTVGAGTGGGGTLFEVPAGTTTVNTLASFNLTNGNSDDPGPLTLDANGAIFGTVAGGTFNGSSIFELAVSPAHLSFTLPPASVSAGSNLSGSGGSQVSVIYPFGNVDAVDTSTVTLTLNGGTFAGGSNTATATTISGVAAFGSLIITTPGTYSLTATDGVHAPVVSSEFTVGATTATQLAFVHAPSGATAGTAINPAVAVAVTDASGNTVANVTTTVTLTINGGIFAGGSNTVSEPAVNGVATFGSLVIDAAGSYTLSATDGSYAGTTSNSFTVTPASASSLAFLRLPGNGTAGVAINPAVQVEIGDQFGNLVNTDTSTVTLTLNGGVFAGGSSTATAVATGGVATFANLVIDIASGYTLTASDGADVPNTSNSFSIGGGTPVKLQFFEQPVIAMAGMAISSPVTVAIEDTWGNLVSTASISVTLTLNGDVFATGSTTTATASYGTATFANLIVDAPGTFTLSASSGSLSSAVSGSFNVYAFQSIASFTSVENALGSIAVDSSGDLFGTTAFGGSLSDGTIFEIAHNAGTITTLASFTLANGVGPQCGLTIDSNGNLFGTALAGGSSSDGTVFELGHNASTITALASFNGTNGKSPYATLNLDSSGDLFGTASAGGAFGDGDVFELTHGATTIKVLASFNRTNGQTPEAGLAEDSRGDFFGTTEVGGLNLDGTVFEVANGSSTITVLASFNGTDGKDPIDVPVVDSSGDLFGTTSAGGASNEGTVFEIAGGTTAVTTLASFNTSNGVYPSGSFFLDASGNLFGLTGVPSLVNTGTVYEIASGSTSMSTWFTFNGTDGADPSGGLVRDLSGDLFGVTSDGGLHSYGTVYELTPAPMSFSFTTPPASTSAGSTLNSGTGVSVTMRYAWGGNIDTADPFTIALTLNGAVFSSGSNTVSATAVNGVATFSNLVIDTAGTYTLTASAGSSTTSTSFTISPLAASTLGFVQQPTNAVAGSAISPTITVATEDMYGNPVSPPSSTVTLTLNGGVFASGSNVATATTVNGIASFGNLAIDAAGSYTVTATGSYSGVTSSSFAVSPSTPAMLAFVQQPSSAPSGVGVLPPVTVVIQDRYGNPVLTDTSTVTLTLNGATFANGFATATASAIGGTATFGNLVIDTPGSYTITAGDSTDAAATATSNGFTVSSQSKLGLLQPPGLATAGVVLSPAVEVAIQDINGHTVTADSSTVTLTLNGGVFAGGSNIVTAIVVSGVAVFANLVIDTAGNYTITASDGLLIGLTSSGFAVNPAASAKLAFIRQPSNSGQGSPISPAVIVAVEDLFGNLVSNDTSTITLTLNGGAFVGGSNTATATAVNGQAVFAGLVLASPGSYMLTAADGVLTSATSTPFGVYLLDSIDSFFPYPNGADPDGATAMDSAGDLFGTDGYGGASGDGTIFELVHGTSAITTLASFNLSNGADPVGLIIDSNGDLFGTTFSGGPFLDGTVFELAAGSTTISVVAAFNATNGAKPDSGLTRDSAGDLFGTTFNGGANGYGEVFEIANGSASLTVVASFNGANGANSNTSVVIDSSGNIFGTTTEQDYGNEDGSVFEIRQGTGVITNLYTFTGSQAVPTITLDSSGNIFGTSENGGTGNGFIFEIAQGTTTPATLAVFNGTNGSGPASVMLDSSGDLFGATMFGGSNDVGTVFEIPRGTTTVIALASFNGADGQSVDSVLTVDSSGNLFGSSNGGGVSDTGVVFELVHGASTISPLAGFIVVSGADPTPGITVDRGGDLFGTTHSAGASDNGTVFEIVQGASTAITLASFNQSTGAAESGLTADSSGNLFGATFGGGANGYGIIFEIPRGSTNIAPLASFTSSNGYDPSGNLVLDSSGDLFGTTIYDGSNGFGSIFELSHGASTITTLASFNDVNGADPNGVILNSAGDLFGTASEGGANGDGTVFEILPGSSAISVLVNFNGTNGSEPVAVVIDSSGDLLGTTYAGSGIYGIFGTVFKIGSGSSSLTTLASFNSFYGGNPEGSLTLDTNGNLFGTTYELGFGAVFEFPAGSSSIVALAVFNGANGEDPQGGLSLDSSGDLFGTTYSGGVDGAGTVFEVSPAPPTLSFTAPPASAVAGGAISAPGGVQVAVQYSWGNLVSSDSSTVTLTLNGGTFAAGSGTVTAVAVNGIATFANLTVDATGAYTLTASDGTDTGVTSGGFNITLAPAQQLAFTQQPGTATAGDAISPAVVVAVENGFGGVITNDMSLVTLTLNGGTFAGGMMTESAYAVSGMAAFGDLVIDAAGSYTLTARDSGLTTATTASFNITQPDLGVSLSDGGVTPTPGETLVYALGYTNTGNVVATGVVLTETAPANTTFDSVDSTVGWTQLNGSTYQLAIGAVNVDADGSAAFAVVVNNPLPAGVQSVTDNAAITDDGTHGPDSNPDNNSAAAVTLLVTHPGLSVTLSDGGATPTPGQSLLYTIDYANSGNIGSTGVELTETLPANTTYNSASSTPGWTLLGGSTYQLAIGTLNSGASGSVNFAVNINNPLASGAARLSDSASIDDDGTNGTDSSETNNSATVVTQLTQITPAISWAEPSSILYGTPLSTTQLDASASVGGITVTGTFVYSTVSGAVLAPGAVLNAGMNQPLNVTFTPTDATDYSDAVGSAQLTVVPALLTVTATSASKTYGAANPNLTDTITGFVNNDTISAVSGAANLSSTATLSSGVAVGGYPITATQGTLAAANYTFSFVGGTLTVNPLAVNLTGSRIYNGGASAAASLLSISDKVSGDTLTLSGSATLSSKNVGAESISSVSGLTLGGGSSNNYTLVGATGSVTISAEALTITAVTNTKTYDTTTSAAAMPAITAGALQGSDTTGFIEAYASAYAGTGLSLIPSGMVNDGNSGYNYTYTFVSVVTGVINKATPVITWANPASIQYGTPLSGVQLDAASGAVAGSFVYTPGSGTTPSPGTQALQAVFTPTDTQDYKPVTATTSITVLAPPNGVTTTGATRAGKASTLYNQSASFTGVAGTYTFTLSNLPAGVTLSAAALVSGSGSVTPVAAGSNVITFTVNPPPLPASPGSVVGFTFQISLNDPSGVAIGYQGNLAASPNQITSTAIAGNSQTVAIIASAGQHTYTLSSLPTGVTLQSVSGSGVTMAAGPNGTWIISFNSTGSISSLVLNFSDPSNALINYIGVLQ